MLWADILYVVGFDWDQATVERGLSSKASEPHRVAFATLEWLKHLTVPMDALLPAFLRASHLILNIGRGEAESRLCLQFTIPKREDAREFDHVCHHLDTFRVVLAACTLLYVRLREGQQLCKRVKVIDLVSEAFSALPGVGAAITESVGCETRLHAVGLLLQGRPEGFDQLAWTEETPKTSTPSEEILHALLGLDSSQPFTAYLDALTQRDPLVDHAQCVERFVNHSNRLYGRCYRVHLPEEVGWADMKD